MTRSSMTLLKAIRQSNISIVVFSKNYASSIWCLEELSQIAERIHEPRYTVFPIFYGVDPSEVQSQSNSFAKAFAEHEQRFTVNLHKVHRWRLAIKQVANLSGWDVPSEPKPEVIDNIIKVVKRKMRELAYTDADLVGIQCRVREVEELLDLRSNDELRVVGICGMGGIGKSTLARVLHDRIYHHFDASYFILNATEFHETTWLRYYKRILMVLDCVDIFDILPSLIDDIRNDLIGGGSRIIIATRDEGVVKKWFQKYEIYRVKLLSKEESLQLLYRKAFKCDFPMRGYEGQIESALQYAGGLPLAIVVLSQCLYNRRASEWSSGLDEFKIVSNSIIMKVLKKSFDELRYECKETFLDITCFFIGKEKKFVEEVLSCGFELVSHVGERMQVLIEKSLMVIINQKIQMHGLLQEMGREIVRQENPCKPEEWSRLWDFDNIYVVMQNDVDIPKVQAIVLELEDSQGSTLRVQSLSRMSNLKLLIFRNVEFSGVLKHLSSKLQYISWHQYPFTSLPSSFEPDNLKELILPDSCITSIWDDEQVSPPSDSLEYIPHYKSSPRLRNLNLSGSIDLANTPNFIQFPNLERLDLEGCVKLSYLHSSIILSFRLKLLNLRNCTNLVSIPDLLFSLPNLEMLNLAGCSKFATCLNFSPFEEIAKN